MTTEDELINSEYEEELARRLCAAHLSMHLGLSLQHTYKRYAQNTPIGDYWRALARRVTKEALGSRNVLSE